MNSLIQPKLCDPGVAYGVISGFPLHDSYPLEDREKLDKLFREDYFAWEAMSKDAISHSAANWSDNPAPIVPGPLSLYFVDGYWEYKGRQIVDRGFILVGPSSSLHDFMKGHNRPYILKTETQTETVSVFSNQECDADAVFVGDLQGWREILVRVYSYLRAGSIFGPYTLAAVADSFPQTTMGIIHDFLNHIRQNGEVTPVSQDSIVINDERARREIKLLDHPRLKDGPTTNRPTFGGILKLMMYRPTPRPLIEASEARNHLREHLQIRGTVTAIGANCRGDVILRFGSPQEVFKAVIPASCVLSKEQEWINSLKNQTLTVTGLVSFYAQEPAMRILEKDQVTFPGQCKQISD